MPRNPNINSFRDLETSGISIQKIIKLLDNEERDTFLKEYQGGLSLFAENFMDTKGKIICTLDGRDTAGKGTNIKKITEYLNPEVFDTHISKKPLPQERNEQAWFERYRKKFPQAREIGFFDRSWYNRAGVEAVMGFCTEEEYDWFMKHVNNFEQEIIDTGFNFLKIYLSINKETQAKRLEERDTEAKRWKSSSVDQEAQAKWDEYTLAKEKILRNTDTHHAPWTIIDSNDRFLSAVEIVKMLISTSDEIAGIVQRGLSLDLSPNKEIRRTAREELVRMEKNGDIPTEFKKFNFAQET